MEEVKREVKIVEEQKDQTLRNIIENSIAKMGEGLPKELNKDRFIQNCITLFYEHPEYKQYNKTDIAVGLMKGAVLGLDFMSRECYLIPYGHKLNFQTDYKGDVKVARRYAKRPVRDIYAEVVRDGDLFEKKIVDNETIVNFSQVPFSNKEIVGVFALVKYVDGGVECETMSKEDIEQVRQAFSKSKNSPAWQNTWGEMAKKTCLRRLCKHITIDFESVERQMAWDEGSNMDFKQVKASEDKVDVIDVSSQAVDESEVAEGKEA